MGLFNDLVETATAAPAEAVAVEATPTAVESNDAETQKRDSVTVTSIDALPDGYVDVKTFAWELTSRNMKVKLDAGQTPGPDDMVDTTAVYAALRGKRWTLPALDAVTTDGTPLGIVIPLQAGLKAWDERPERGVGSGATMTPERRVTRILRAGKAYQALKTWEKRWNRYVELLAEVGATPADAHAAFDAWAETEEAKKEIADNNKPNGEDE